jgi:hypothetical protein
MSGLINAIGISLSQTGVVSFTGSDNNTITLSRGITYTPANMVAVFNNQTSNRALGTIYQNTNPSSLEVIVSALCTVTAAGSAYLQGISDLSSTPSTAVSSYAGIPTTTVTNLAIYGVLSFYVAPNAYYKVATTLSNGTVVLDKWFEATF